MRGEYLALDLSVGFAAPKLIPGSLVAPAQVVAAVDVPTLFRSQWLTVTRLETCWRFSPARYLL